jgi:hypothetical protein
MADQSLVSWQSAFWALVPLALNSMLQPTGPKTTYSGIGSLALRASPIICATDALTSLFQILSLMKFQQKPYRNLPLRRAAKVWLLTRSEPTLGEETPVEALQWVRLLVFIFGTLSQGVKLFACQGIPWTQTWGYLYVTSFAIFTILEYLADTAKDTNLDGMSIKEHVSHLKGSQTWEFSNFSIKIAWWAHTGFIAWALAVAVPPLVHIEDYSLMPWWLWILSIPALSLYFMMLAYSQAVLLVPELVAVLTGHGIYFTQLLIDFYSRYRTEYLNLFWQCFFLLFFYPVVLLVLAALSKSLFPRHALAMRIRFGIGSLFGGRETAKDRDVILQSTPTVRTSLAKEQEKLLAFLFIFCTFGAAAAWYGRKYDSRATSKPGWTDSLG